MEQLIMKSADRTRRDVNNNGDASNKANANSNGGIKNNAGNNRAVSKLLASTALLLFALIAAPAQAIVVTYTHTDAQGSVVAISDSERNVTRFGYEPYGLPTSGSGTGPTDSPGFTGHVHDGNSGLVYMQQRYYDPEVGTFLSVDPVQPSVADGSNFNRYWYANNNPYRFTDPDGRISCEHIGKARCKKANGDHSGDENTETESDDLAISDEERKMLEDEDLAGFWGSRHERGDPWAIRGLALWDPGHSSLTDGDIKMGQLLKGLVYAGIAMRDGDAPSLDDFEKEFKSIGVEIARQHADSTDRIGNGIVGLSEGARYHHRAFEKFGLPPTTYGGTPVRPAAWNGYLSYESQAKLINWMVGYCTGCPN